MASSPITSADEPLIALLDRVVQEIFGIGIRLRAATEEGTVRRDVQGIVLQLAAAVEDIRETVMTSQFGEDWVASGPSEAPSAVTPLYSDAAPASVDNQGLVPGRAIPYLRLASDVLQRPEGEDAVTPDGGRWIALNHAVHHLHASIAALQNTWPDGAA